MDKSVNNGVGIRVVNVSKSYFLGETKVSALLSATLTIQAGEFIALCGTSGSGKTTLLNLLGGMAMASQGEIWIGETEVGKMNDAELSRFRANCMGFVFQNFNLLPVLSAQENVEYALINSVLTGAERSERASRMLQQVGLGSFAHHRPDQLSGGQRQRVAIARAFVRAPGLIIADEPTANLDRRTAQEILELMAGLNRQTGSTVIMATHDPLAVKKAARIIRISDGRIVSPDEELAA